MIPRTLCIKNSSKEEMYVVESKQEYAKVGEVLHGLKEDSEAEEHAAEEDSHASSSTRDEGGGGSTSRTCRCRGGGSAAEASDGDLGGCGSSGAGGSGRGRHDRAKCGVSLVGILSTAGVVLSAGAGACAVAVAVGFTLVAPLLADEEWEGLRVLGDVG